jgi:hypothetical protein
MKMQSKRSCNILVSGGCIFLTVFVPGDLLGVDSWLPSMLHDLFDCIFIDAGQQWRRLIHGVLTVEPRRVCSALHGKLG